MRLLCKDQKVNCFWQNRLAFIRDAYSARVLSQTRDKSASVSTRALDKDFSFDFCLFNDSYLFKCNTCQRFVVHASGTTKSLLDYSGSPDLKLRVHTEFTALNTECSMLWRP